MKKKVAVTTRIKFWLSGAGVYLRVAQLIRYLSEHTDLTVLFLGIQEINDAPKIKRFRNIKDFFWVLPNEIADDHTYSLELEKHFKNYQYDCCIFSRWDCAPFRRALHGNAKTFLDVDDIPSETITGINQLKKLPCEPLATLEQEELLIYKEFDYLIVIQREHLDKFNRQLPQSTVILTSHAFVFTPKLIRPTVNNIGYIASNWETNIDALEWFLVSIWEKFETKKITLNIYGGVGTPFSKKQLKNMTIHMHLHNIEQAYHDNDIIINPVRYGSGLKIKTIEALANGLPLLTTEEGARGLKDLDNHALLIANTPEDFSLKLRTLIENQELRRLLGKNAYLYAAENLTPDKCYGPLLKTIISIH